jgi:hypothetical protein
LIAAKVAGTEPKLSDVAYEIDAADKAGAFDMDRLYEPVKAMLESSAADTGHTELKRLSADATERSPPVATDATAYINQDAIDYAQNRAAELIGKKLVDGELVDNPEAKWAISDTTRDGIRKLVVAAEQQGQSVQQLADAIRKSALFSPERAKRIAQWELSCADNNGSLIAWKRSGVVKGKRWKLGSEHIVCDECDANADAGVIGLDDEFPSGHQCSPAHPGCSCGTLPVI